MTRWESVKSPDSLAILALVGVLAGGLTLYKHGPSFSPDQNPCARPDYHAVSKAEAAVLASLKAPSTAVIQVDDKYRRYKDVTCKFDLTGTVDAQNSFGAMLRSSWRVTATRSGVTDVWIITNVLVDE